MLSNLKRKEGSSWRMVPQGQSNSAIAGKLGLHRVTVATWRARFLDQGLEGLYDELRCGGPRSIGDEQIAQLIAKTLKTKPVGGTHWSCRTLAAQSELSKSTVQRVWKAFG